MFNAIIDILSRLENLGSHIPSFIQLAVLIAWIFIIQLSKSKYQVSLGLSLFLLTISILAQLVTLTFLAQIIAEYAFMFLGVGILQIVFMKQDDID